jgi:hypothetical protein
MVGQILSRAFGILGQKPIQLWGLSLLSVLLTVIGSSLGGAVPLIVLSVAAVLQLGVAAVYLNGLRGQPVNSMQLFQGFNNKFFRNAGGIGWMFLWILIWGMIPIAGFVFAIIKYYSYRFVPYIMLNEPDIKATEALKKSMAMTDGYKGKMFLTDFLIGLVVGVVAIVTVLLAMIPGIGPLLAVIFGLVLLVIYAVLPLLLGLIAAAYYDEISKK